MRYIVRLKNNLTLQQRRILESLCADIIYESNFISVIGIETDNFEEIAELEFIQSIRESQQGEYQDTEFLSTITFQPPIKKGVLTNNQLLGWGDTRVCVIDSGVNDKDVHIIEHKDFTGTGTKDIKSHGTIIAKIIKHFAKGANIYSAKIGNEKPDEVMLMNAIEWAVDKRMDVINISSGFKRDKRCDGTCELCELINAVTSEHMVCVIAAGNNDMLEDSIDCPGVAANGVTIGAIDESKKIASFSSIGKRGGFKPNLVAPGRGWIDGRFFEGTSFSAPVVSGILAAILKKVGNVSTAVEYIYNTAEDLNLPRHYQGFGCIDIEKLVEVVMHETINFESERQNQGS